MNQKEKHRLHNNWEYAKNLWTKKQKEFKLDGWELKKDHAKTRLGQCDHGKKIISISTYFMRGKGCNYSKVKNTLLHEIAHCLTPGQKHNLIWKKTALKIGCDGKVRSTMDVPPRNWKMVCRKCNWEKEYFRKPKADGKVCLKCKRPPIVQKMNK